MREVRDPRPAGQRFRVLEIGCGDRPRLRYLSVKLHQQVFGIDPSEQGILKARARGVQALKATAEKLHFPDASFDVVIFGFCLYVCDDADLFRIALEADRTLGNSGWLLILDFEARAPLYRPYRHLAGIAARKMDYNTTLLWHPAYTLASYEKLHHGTQQWAHDADEWVSLACLRKLQPER